MSMLKATTFGRRLLSSGNLSRTSQKRFDTGYADGPGNVERKGVNAWEAPLNPGRWKGDQRGVLVVIAAGVGSYALLKYWVGAKQDEKDKGYLSADAQASGKRPGFGAKPNPS